ncbi:cysteine ABC transporter ATP-binding protein [Shewanella putrefaciens]|nr:cysteine ABC transporter ATP-binding protein [Shewanella putrefaciens]
MLSAIAMVAQAFIIATILDGVIIGNKLLPLRIQHRPLPLMPAVTSPIL